jgi:hypothetical protein
VEWSTRYGGQHRIDGVKDAGIMSIMKIIRDTIIVLALTSVALATSACPEKGPAEKAGEKIDKAIDKTKDAIK